MTRFKIVILLFISLLSACKTDDPSLETLVLENISVGSINLSKEQITNGVPVDKFIILDFTKAVDVNSAKEAIQLQTITGIAANFNVNSTSETDKFVISPIGLLQNNTTYTLTISDQLKGANGASFDPVTITFTTVIGDLEIIEAKLGEQEIDLIQNIFKNVPLNLQAQFTFSAPVDQATFQQAFSLTGPQVAGLDFSFSNNDQSVTITTAELPYWKKYELTISENLLGTSGERFSGFSKAFYTTLDSTFKFPEITNEQLLTKVQEQTFKYFWDFAHPESGLIRERNTSGNLVTIGGSGFGVMTILVGIERGFITRQQGVNRLAKIVNFLAQADRFHGVWPHWMNGTTGEVIPFSANDDGGDIVETAFMIQGLLTARQYLDQADATEKTIIDKITQLWESVEWDWYTQGEDVIYWHWSPNFGFEKNLPVRGWNEALIVYVLAASSPTHGVSADVYHQGWARDGAIVNGSSFYGIELPLGPDIGGPLFFEHYSFLGLDPRNLSDQYANYWTQATNHTLINQAYCIANPKRYVGYSSDSWGLTASDNHIGYSAHSPTNDLGVITPTAAISSIPYTPEASMDAIRQFYYQSGDRIWDEYGFHDAFNPTADWYADSYLAIDQGPIVIMIENYRTGLLWNNFMTDPEIQNGLNKLGFSY